MPALRRRVHTGAISLGEEGIVVSPEKCIGCGTCASACPTGCLTAANPTDEELFGAVEAALAENEAEWPSPASAPLQWPAAIA